MRPLANLNLFTQPDLLLLLLTATAAITTSLDELSLHLT